MIDLSKIGLFPLLQAVFGHLHITQAVYDEVVSEETDLPGSAELRAAVGEWISVHSMPPDHELAAYRQQFSISRPDASVIVLARQQHADLVLIDERELRRAAEDAGLSVIGTGGVLVRAKELGLIDNVRELLAAAVDTGLRISESVQQAVLEAAGELDEA